MYSIFLFDILLIWRCVRTQPYGPASVHANWGVIVGNAVADFLAVDILNIILQGAAAMRPLASCLL